MRAKKADSWAPRTMTFISIGRQWNGVRPTHSKERPAVRRTVVHLATAASRRPSRGLTYVQTGWEGEESCDLSNSAGL